MNAQTAREKFTARLESTSTDMLISASMHLTRDFSQMTAAELVARRGIIDTLETRHPELAQYLETFYDVPDGHEHDAVNYLDALILGADSLGLI